MRPKLRFYQSFYVAIKGIYLTILTQRNMRIHLGVTGLIIAVGWYTHISRSEWMYLLASIFLVLICECFNTAIECAIDLVTKKKKYRAMMSKDIAAGAVLLSALHALIAGILIFSPKLEELIRGG